MPSFELDEHIAAPIETVWAVLSDHRGYAAWAGVDSSVLECEGGDDPDGVGAVRHLRKGPISIREEVVAFERLRSFAYTVVGGPPVRDYLGVVTLSEAGSGTRVHWTVRFEPKIPLAGAIMRPIVRKVIAELLSAATREAERRSRGGRAAGDVRARG
jgi:carbon monoxide dehydrogenase subunit G